MMETSLRKSLILSRGDFSIFFVRPLSAVFLILALLILVTPMIPGIGKKRNRLPKEDVS
jgi:putative tricarboxylic transport membrane protein